MTPKRRLLAWLARVFAKKDHIHALIAHDHDDTYYTETEVDNLLDGKADDGHSHSFDGVPVGAIMYWAAYDLPDKWLAVNNQLLDPNDYPDLFAVLGYDYGQEASFFQLPALVGLFVRCSGHNGGSFVGQTGGEAEVTLYESQIPSHVHTTVIDYNVAHAGSEQKSAAPYATDWNQGSDLVTEATGGGQPHNNIPPYMYLIPIIKALP